MKAYKDYMDRIELDGEQHRKLLDAVLAAEKEASAGALPEQMERETGTKVRRFPLKKLGWIASAAAVIVIAVAVGGQSGSRKQADTTATEAAAPQASNMNKDTEWRTAEEASYTVTAPVIVPGEKTTAPTAVPRPESAVPAANEGITVISNEASEQNVLDGSFTWTAEDDAADRLGGILNAAEPFMKELAKQETVSGNVEFVYQEAVYTYDSVTGSLFTGGKGCILPENLRKALNSLLAEYPADK